MSRSQAEFRLTCAVADFLRRAMPDVLAWSHFPAGEKRSAVTGARLKRMGTQPGWPDFLINLPGGRIGYIELKSAKGRLSAEQEAFRDSVVINGARWALCRSVAEVDGILALWLAGSDVSLKARVAA